MKRKINAIIKQAKTNFANVILKKENSDILKWIRENTPEKLKNGNYNLSTIIYWILNDLKDFPKCKKCGKYLGVNKNIRFFVGYKKYCLKCSINSVEAIEKRKQTCLKKYGVENPFSNEEIKKKIEKHNLEKYGVNCPAKSEENLKNIEKRNLEKYGVKSYQSTDEFKDKIRKTCQEKYGTNNVFESDIFKIKNRKTLMEKYGVDHNMKSKKIQELKKQNYIEKYGENYKIIIWGNKGNEWQNRRAYEFILKNPNVEPLFTINEYVKGKKENVKTKFNFKCKHCGTIFQSVWDNGKTNVCPKCKRIKCTSNFEKEIANFIENILNKPIKTNDRTLISPLELDIILESEKICFEMDGIYWHCDDVNLNHNYHLNKTKKCEEKNYQLIHIFENEWIYKKDIVKSRIKNLLGVYDKVVYGRKCVVKVLDRNTTNKFIDECHIQGCCPSSVNLGLFYNDELVSVMTFGKSRFNRKYEWELLRFCNKLGYHVIGGAGKLLKYFERNYNPKSLVSYADRRWSKGNLYKKLGFKLDHVSRPNYWYIDFSTYNLYSRVKFQKHKLKKILDIYDEKLSECENMKKNKYGRIFDCGNMVFIKEYCD